MFHLPFYIQYNKDSAWQRQPKVIDTYIHIYIHSYILYTYIYIYIHTNHNTYIWAPSRFPMEHPHNEVENFGLTDFTKQKFFCK